MDGASRKSVFLIFRVWIMLGIYVVGGYHKIGSCLGSHAGTTVVLNHRVIASKTRCRSSCRAWPGTSTTTVGEIERIWDHRTVPSLCRPDAGDGKTGTSNLSRGGWAVSGTTTKSLPWDASTRAGRIFSPVPSVNGIGARQTSPRLNSLIATTCAISVSRSITGI